MLPIALAFLRGALGRALSTLLRPIQLPAAAWLLPLLAALWFWHAHSVTEHKLEACQTARKHDAAEWAASVAAAKAATAAAQQKGKESADEAQSLHDQLAASQRNLRDYIAAHRVVRSAAPSAAAASSGSGDAPSLPLVAPTVSTVEVPDSILDIADQNYIYAQSCYAFGQSLIQKGLVASPQKR